MHSVEVPAALTPGRANGDGSLRFRLAPIAAEPSRVAGGDRLAYFVSVLVDQLNVSAKRDLRSPSGC